jgi:xylose isomerase-like TIM barrel protein
MRGLQPTGEKRFLFEPTELNSSWISSLTTPRRLHKPMCRKANVINHMQIMEGDLAMKLSKYAAHCGHVQIAGVAKRNEPDTGEVDYSYLFDHLDQTGYSGWVGCEYRPAGDTEEGLTWFK